MLGCCFDASLYDYYSVVELVGFLAVQNHFSAELGVDDSIVLTLAEVNTRMDQRSLSLPFVRLFSVVSLMMLSPLSWHFFWVLMYIVKHSHQTAAGDVCIVASLMLAFSSFIDA